MKYHTMLVFYVFSIFLLVTHTAFADTSLVSEKKLEDKIKAVENIKDMDEQTKTNLLEQYTKTQDYLDDIKASKQLIEKYQYAIKHSPAKIKKLKKQLLRLEKHLEKESAPENIEKSTRGRILADLEQKLSSESASLAAIEAKNSDLGQRLADESDSAAEIRKQLISNNHELEQLLEDKKLVSAGVGPEQKKSSQWLLDAHVAALRSKTKMLDLQLTSQPVRVQLLQLKKELSDHELKKIRNRVQFLEQQVNFKRSSEVKKTQEITREEEKKAQGKHPLIQLIAKLNTELSEAITIRSKQLGELEAGDDKVNKESKRLIEEQASTKRKLEIAGLNQILGQVLLEQKKALPDSKLYLKNLKKREALLAESSLQHLQYQEELRKLKHKKEYMAELMQDLSPEEQDIIKGDLKELLKTRRKLLEKAISIDESYLQAIGNLDFAEKKLLIIADSYSHLLDEHLFWLRNASILNLDNIKDIPRQIIFFLSPSQLLGFTNDFIYMIKNSMNMLPAGLLIIFLLIKKRRIRDLLINTGQKTRKISHDSLLHTVKAILYTFLLAAPAPVLVWLISRQLATTPDLSNFSYAVANGLNIIVTPLFSLNFFRSMCIPGGLSEVHFKWDEQLIAGLRKEMGRLMMTFLPAIFITAVLMSSNENNVNSGLGRLSLFVTLITFMIFFYRLLKPENGFLSSVANKNPDGVFARYQRFWYFLGLTLVSGLIVLAYIGYVYTAGQLTASLIYTLWFIFALTILQQLSVRWLILTRRKFALKQAYEKRKAAQKLKQIQDVVDEENEHIPDIEEPEIDMISLGKESTKLLNFVLFLLGASGLVVIWADVLPALGIFEKVVLWHHQGIVDGTEKMLPVTLWDLMFSILVAIVTIVGAKRLPAIVEILLLQNTSMGSGNRYTITTLINYTIMGIGLFSVFNIMGADWARFQWLFAALSVGIGFGLQEIVANFISGLIILFERPIRVGDYVSVGENEGVVSRIQIRATTIMTRDRKELLVPNKEFITGQLLNWSLSDPTTRLIIPVGVAYGSDIPKAKQLLIDAAVENERVLKEPSPRVVFFNFGDNTLDLQLRCFIGNVDFRLNTISEINEVINEKFNAAGISIAFPQRDVHLDISQPIDIRLQGQTL